MRITLLTAYYGGTHGTAASARDVVRAVLACGARLSVVCPDEGDLHAKGAEWLRLPRRAPWRWRPSRFAALARRAAAARRVAATAGDRVIVNGWASHAYWREIADRVSGPTTMIVRESPRHFTMGDRDAERPDLAAALAAFDSLIFVSDRLREEWLAYPALRDKRAHYLPNCCEEEAVSEQRLAERAQVRRGLGLGASDFVIAYPATVEQRKGQDLLLDIAPRLFEQVPDARIVLVGAVGTPWGAALVRRIEEDPRYARIAYWPARPQVLDLLHGADVLAFPSRAEAMPRTVLEAMALATPVVACAVDGVPELIEHGRSGLLVPADDAQALLGALLEVRGNPALARSRASAARERYARLFSRARQFERMRRILDELATAGA